MIRVAPHGGRDRQTAEYRGERLNSSPPGAPSSRNRLVGYHGRGAYPGHRKFRAVLQHGVEGVPRHQPIVALRLEEIDGERPERLPGAHEIAPRLEGGGP